MKLVSHTPTAPGLELNRPPTCRDRSTLLEPAVAPGRCCPNLALPSAPDRIRGLQGHSVMGGWPRYEIPEGWVARGWRFEVETTMPSQRALIAQHFGARRFAYNWALAQVSANLDARAANPSVPPLSWTLPTLRKAWNQAKDEVAPWWPACSKDTYACGIADLVAALHAWSASKRGRRAGSPVR